MATIRNRNRNLNANIKHLSTRIAALAVLTIGLSIAPTTASALTRHVGVNGDDQGGSNRCLLSFDPCATIDHALTWAADGDTIQVGAGTYTEVKIVIDKDVTIRGADPATTIIQAASSPTAAPGRVMRVKAGTDATLEDLTIQHGNAIVKGGGILNKGELALRNTHIVNNIAAEEGGGIYNDGVLVIENGTLDNNSTTATYGDGGGIYNTRDGTLDITNSILSHNSSGYGGGICTEGVL